MHLFTDLDNTVIYSHRHMISDPIVWVESLYGKHQSFMSEKAYRYYKLQDWMKIVPVTTRTHQQYGRLQELRDSFGWREALICNGSILLRDGEEDPEWTRESMEISRPDREAYWDAYKQACRIADPASIVSVDPFLFYIKASDAEQVYGFLRKNTDLTHLSIMKDQRKIYCIPKSLSKGNATERYKKRFGALKTIAAGDSEFDISMLQQADVCICPEKIAKFETTGKKIVCNGLFSDEICDKLEAIRKEGSMF